MGRDAPPTGLLREFNYLVDYPTVTLKEPIDKSALLLDLNRFIGKAKNNYDLIKRQKMLDERISVIIQTLHQKITKIPKKVVPYCA